MNILQEAEGGAEQAAEQTSLYETVIGGIETFSDFLWGGNWGETVILPVGPITMLLLAGAITALFLVGIGLVALAESIRPETP